MLYLWKCLFGEAIYIYVNSIVSPYKGSFNIFGSAYSERLYIYVNSIVSPYKGSFKVGLIGRGFMHYQTGEIDHGLQQQPVAGNDRRCLWRQV